MPFWGRFSYSRTQNQVPGFGLSSGLKVLGFGESSPKFVQAALAWTGIEQIMGYRLGRWRGWCSIQPSSHDLLQVRRGKWLREEHPVLAGLKIWHERFRVAAAHID
jgi:hypothetical protein